MVFKPAGAKTITKCAIRFNLHQALLFTHLHKIPPAETHLQDDIQIFKTDLFLQL